MIITSLSRSLIRHYPAMSGPWSRGSGGADWDGGGARRTPAEIRPQVAEEEAEAIAEEIAENKETALSVRVPESLSRDIP